MNAKHALLILIAGVFALGSCCNSGSLNSTSASLKTEKDTACYYLGFLYGGGLAQSGLKDPNIAAIVAGMNNAIQKTDTIDQYKIQMFLTSYFEKVAQEMGETNRKKGEEFLKNNLKKEGVDTLSDGIQYKVLVAGNGVKPQETDVVKVHYKGTLIDGTEFDASKEEPVEFPLNRVIRGWTLAIQHMPVGSKWIIYIPGDMAYGPRGAGNLIGPNETLIFEVELLDVVTPEGN